MEQALTRWFAAVPASYGLADSGLTSQEPAQVIHLVGVM
jgi:hypothetical protein